MAGVPRGAKPNINAPTPSPRPETPTSAPRPGKTAPAKPPVAEETTPTNLPSSRSPEVDTPNGRTPDVETPNGGTPQVDAPNVRTPEVETPNARTPEVETPNARTPEVDTPNPTKSAKLFLEHGDEVIKRYGDDGVEMLSQGIIAKRVTQDGHTLKVMADGRILRCSTCDELAKEFAEELADPKNKRLAEWFKAVQARAAKDPEGVADEIKLIEEELQKIRKNNPKLTTNIIELPIKSGNRYSPNPNWNKGLPAFPNARTAKRKTPVQGGGGLRERWKDSDGTIYEWDSQHGKIEKYNKNGKHLGEFDPVTGQETKPADDTRKVEP
jgi:hypothetical protein